VARFFDFDFDGDLDLFEGNDFGPNRYWQNQGQGRFKGQEDHPLARASSFSMGATIADYDNSGQFAIHISNMYSHAGNRLLPLVDGLGPNMAQRLRLMARGNQHFEYDRRSSTWRECAVERGVHLGGWAWACLFFDLDNDSDKDLFVVNGFTSHKDRKAPEY
jgi:hypothetical protein